MIYPTIHINGTGSETLLDDYRTAVFAVRTAIDAMRYVSPNGRDYYPQGDRVIESASKDHWLRVERLQSVLAELEALAAHVVKAVP